MSEGSNESINQLINSNQIEKISQIGIFNIEGSERPFGGIIRHGIKIIIFIRHFNCGFCQDYLIELKERLTQEKLKEKELIVIGCGHWSTIKPYKDLLDLPFEIYSDNTRELFNELGMICSLSIGEEKPNNSYAQKSVLSTVINSISNGLKMGIKTFLQSGKISQLGGEFIFKDNECKFAHRMQNTRDHTEPEELEKIISKI
ncbi:AhpC/TSA antioxidant enzyme-domain-containing protein [Melampsora americana]|nr:AhpC/TSA antioxidant enzyme-domain-containing protein [Melampsora americana]